MKTNGTRKKKIAKARLRVLQEAQSAGSITNAKAKKIGRWNQAWFHLNKMVQVGVLKRNGFNRWIPVKRLPKNVEL
jgi:hypothetical protein